MDNSDNFMTATLEDEMTGITNALNNPTVEPRILQQTVLQIVELYPYIEYMKYLLPGSIALAMFVSVMIGGGMLYIDDKARGVHEGYLVTPITKAELVLGLNAAGAIKAVMTGVVITLIGSLLAGVGTIFRPGTMLGLAVMIFLTSLAFNTMMFLLMVRVEDPLVPRAIFGILNTLLFFPSGAVYPIQAFPRWLAGHRQRGSVHFRGARFQIAPAERNRPARDLARHGLSISLRNRDLLDRRAVVQAHSVKILVVHVETGALARSADPKGRQFSGTFSSPPDSIMLRS